jgi:hypothetical protein
MHVRAFGRLLAFQGNARGPGLPASPLRFDKKNNILPVEV